MSGWGSVFAQGLLGGVMGGAQAVASTSLEEVKAETERRRAEYLAKLSRETHAANLKTDIEAIPAKGAAETGVMTARQDALRPGIIQTAADSKRAEKTVEFEFVEQDIKKIGAVTKAKEEAEQPFKMEQIAAQGQQQLRAIAASSAARKELEAMATARDWTAGADGNYYDGNGKLVTTEVRLEGRGSERVPIKVPQSKLDNKGGDWQKKEELDSINKQIEKARADMHDPAKRKAAAANLPRLQAEKQKLLGGASSATSFNTPADFINSILGASS